MDEGGESLGTRAARCSAFDTLGGTRTLSDIPRGAARHAQEEEQDMDVLDG